MKEEIIKKQQKDILKEHLIKEKEIEITSLRARCDQQIRKLEREIKYLQGIY